MTTNEYWTAIVLIGLGISVTAPLSVTLIARLDRRGITPRQRVVFAAAAVSALAGLTTPAGPVAVALVLPWCATAATSAAAALRRLVAAPSLVGLVAVGTFAWWTNASLWLIAHRAGIEPLGFDRSITLLTVAHFHHAGLGLTALLGTAASVSGRRWPWGVAAAQQLGMVAVALGITFDDRLALAGTIGLTIALTGWLVLALLLRRSTGDRRARRLLVVSSGAWFVPMTLAIAWAVSPFRPRPLVGTFETMIRWHGAINAVGLVLCGLAAIELMTRRQAASDVPAHRPEERHVVATTTDR